MFIAKTQEMSSLGMTWINLRRVFNCYWYTLLEYLAVKSSLFNDLLLSWRKPVFKKEVLLSDICCSDRILHIGCGILPTHTILLAQQTGAQITGIDNLNKAITLARNYIKKEKLDTQITLEYADGSTYPLKDFTVIFIAINVFPIDTILLHISKESSSGTKILIKSIADDVNELLNRLGLEEKFHILKIQKNPKSSSYLLQKL